MPSFAPFKAFALSFAVFGTGLTPIPGMAMDAQSIDILRAYFDTELAPLLTEPKVLEAIRNQNERTAALNEDEILELDNAWREQVDASEQPLIKSVVEGKLPLELNHIVANAGGVITEMFVMDAKGLNVAATMPTSDYWQGDEAKFQETFGVGTGAVLIGEPEFDMSAGVSQVQISATITDPATEEPIGAITIGLVTELLL